MEARAIQRGVLGILLALSAGGWATAATTVSSGYWTNNAVWDSGVPGVGANVVIASTHTVTADVSTAGLNALSVTGTLVFAGADTVITSTTVTVAGTVTHLPQIATATNAFGQWDISSRIYLVCSNLTVNTGGSINANVAGYSGGPAGGPGRGPGGGPTASIRGNGGGYGGIGGLSPGWGFPSITYGSASAPVQPGSGGGAKSVDANTTGIGGGLIRIQATGQVTVNGSVAADGGPGFVDSGGGGSGGGINISCRTFAGAGSVSANGGASPTWGAAGGGGRIAITYNTTAQSNLNETTPPTVLFSVNYAARSQYAVMSSRPGTLYLSDNSFLSSVRLQSAEFAGVTSWRPGNLMVTNKWLVFPSGFTLSTTNDILVSDGGIFEITNATALIGGNLTVTNGTLYAYAGPTNGSIPAYGALVSVGGDVLLANNGWIFPVSTPTNGGSPVFRMRHLTITTTNAGFDANEAGFSGSQNGSLAAYGPGGGACAPSTSWGGGGGYGGQGGQGRNPSTPGSTYGTVQQPTEPGSGGAGWATVSIDTRGGGLIRLEASGTATLNGTLRANGRSSYDWAGASGGAIYLICRTLAGTNAVLAASGGSHTSAGLYGGGGGGGRIALWRLHDSPAIVTSSWSVAVSGGVGWVNGDVGTVFWGSLRPSGTIFVVH